jgi:hypothetical protein
MARREVIEITCGRCGKVETQTAEELPKEDGNKLEFQLRFQGKKISYDDLCRRCRRTLENYVEKITMPPPKEREVKNPAGAG